MLFLLLAHKVEKAHLTGERRFALLVDRVAHLRVDHHHLLARSAQAVERPRLDEALQRALVDVLAGHALDKIFQ